MRIQKGENCPIYQGGVVLGCARLKIIIIAFSSDEQGG